MWINRVFEKHVVDAPVPSGIPIPQYITGFVGSGPQGSSGYSGYRPAGPISPVNLHRPIHQATMFYTGQYYPNNSVESSFKEKKEYETNGIKHQHPQTRFFK